MFDNKYRSLLRNESYTQIDNFTAEHLDVFKGLK